MVEINEANARAAGQAAERLLNDPFLTEAFDEMLAIETDKALRGPDAEQRERARLKVEVIAELRGALEAVFTHWKQAAAIIQAARARE